MPSSLYLLLESEDPHGVAKSWRMQGGRTIMKTRLHGTEQNHAVGRRKLSASAVMLVNRPPPYLVGRSRSHWRQEKYVSLNREFACVFWVTEHNTLCSHKRWTAIRQAGRSRHLVFAAIPCRVCFPRLDEARGSLPRPQIGRPEDDDHHHYDD